MSDVGSPGPSELRLRLADTVATEAMGRRIGARMEIGQGLALCGELGAGKTCLARGVGQGLRLLDPQSVCSPTYLLVIEHPGPVPMLHVDAYLPEKTRGFLEDGGLDYLHEARGVVVVEWADRLADLLPDPTLWVTLTPLSGGRGREALVEDRRGAFPWIDELG